MPESRTAPPETSDVGAAGSAFRSTEGSNSGSFTPLDWGLLLASAGIWSGSFAFIAIGLESFTPAQVAFGRIFFGLCATALIPGALTKVDRADWPRVAAVGVFWMAAPLSLFPIAEQWIDSSAAGMLNAGMPLGTVMLSWLFLRRGPYRHELWGVVVGFVGVGLVVGPTATGEGENQLLGVICCLVAVLCYALAAHLNVPLVQRYGSPAVLLRALATAAVLTFPFAVFGIRHASPTLRSVGAIVLLGAAGTGVAYAMAAHLISRVGAIRGSVITFVIPPLSVLWGVLFFSDKVSGLALVGTAIILLGAWITGRTGRTADEVAPSAEPDGLASSVGHDHSEAAMKGEIL